MISWPNTCANVTWQGQRGRMTGGFTYKRDGVGGDADCCGKLASHCPMQRESREMGRLLGCELLCMVFEKRI
jgi:hypothetical protein